MPQDPGPGDAARTPDPQAATAQGGPDLRLILLTVVALVLAGWAVKGLSAVLMPLTAAILIGLAVMPVRDWVAARLPERLSFLGIVAAMGAVLSVLAVFVAVLVLAARQIVAEIPIEAGQVVELIQGGQDEGQDGGGGTDSVAEGAEAGAGGALDPDVGPALAVNEEAPAEGGTGAEAEGEPGGGLPEAGDAAGDEVGSGSGDEAGSEAGDESGNEAGDEAGSGFGGGDIFSGSTLQTLRTLGERALGAAGGAAAAALNSAVGVLGGLVFVIFLTLLLLGESGDWRRKVAAALPWPDDWRLRESADVIAQKVRAYLLIQAGLGFVSALLYAAWLGFWQVGLLVVWPLLIFVLNFIPTIGSLIGGTLPVAYTLLTQGVWPAVGVGLGILVIENVMGNLVGPRVQGRNVALSPLVVLVALAFWGWAWGIAGALLAVPVTVGMVVLGAHVPVLRPWALLLSNKTEWVGLDEATRPE